MESLFNLMLTSKLGVIWLPHATQPPKMFPKCRWQRQNTLRGTAPQHLSLCLGAAIFF